MTKIKIGINGLGRIGKSVIRAYFKRDMWNNIEIAAINIRKNIDDALHLFKYDSTHGVFEGDVRREGDYVYIKDKKICLFQENNPEDIKWSDAGVNVAFECTGKFKSRDLASRYLTGGAKKVLISAPASDADKTIVYGVNENILTDSDKIISVGSCTTNCLAPVVKILNDHFTIENGFMTTIHAYTNDQNLLDASHKDLRRARAAATSIIPTTTGAAKTIGLVIPELKGKLDGTALRVPVKNVSLVDFTFNTEKATDIKQINQVIKNASAGEMKGVLGYNNLPLVSTDFNGRVESSVFDTTETYALSDHTFRIMTWYDNEWGFSCRMLDIASKCLN